LIKKKWVGSDLSWRLLPRRNHSGTLLATVGPRHAGAGIQISHSWRRTIRRTIENASKHEPKTCSFFSHGSHWFEFTVF